MGLLFHCARLKCVCVCVGARARVLPVQSLCPVSASSLNGCQTSVCRPASPSVTLQETHTHTSLRTRAHIQARESRLFEQFLTHSLKKHSTELYLLWFGCMKSYSFEHLVLQVKAWKPCGSVLPKECISLYKPWTDCGYHIIITKL